MATGSSRRIRGRMSEWCAMVHQCVDHYCWCSDHVNWARAYSGTIQQLQEYVKKTYTTGLTWNKGVSVYSIQYCLPLTWYGYFGKQKGVFGTIASQCTSLCDCMPITLEMVNYI